MNNKNEIITIGKGKHINLLKKDNWEYVERVNITGIVVIIAVTNNNELIFVEQFRPPVNSSVIELPAGLVGDTLENKNEDIINAAKRELFEETGYVSNNFKFIMKGPPSAGISKEVVSFYKADNCLKEGLGGGDDTENIKTHIIKIENAETWLDRMYKKGILIDPKVYTGIFFAIKNL